MTTTTNRTLAFVIGLALIVSACSTASEAGEGTADAVAALEQELAEANRDLAEMEVLLADAAADRGESVAISDALMRSRTNETAYIEAWIAQDLDAMMETYTDDTLFVDETFGDYMEGKDIVRNMLTNIFSVTDPDGIELLDSFVSDDGTRAVSQWEWGGTNFNGNKFDLPFVLIHEYRDGKIVKETIYYASPNAREQLMGSP
jgi:steroid delta-isomerase-like uncharacterized protein